MFSRINHWSNERFLYDEKYDDLRDLQRFYTNLSTLNSNLIKLIKKKNKVAKIKDPSCLNCGHPFFGAEKFCPDCGQANKGNKITFWSFVHEVFNGLFNFEAKFWTTIIPLLIKPGKVSRDYIDGKRQRYSNPFRFYLTVSIIFFLLIGLSKTIDKYEALTTEAGQEIAKVEEKDTIKETKEVLTQAKIDSIKEKLDKDLKKSFVPVIARKKILEEVEKSAKDTVALNNGGNNINFGGTRLDDFAKYVEKYPDAKMDVALDSLGFEKNFTNRFLFTKAKRLNSVTKSKESRDAFFSEVLSYGSVALFVFLPFFTLFLRFFYIRRKFTYVDHLIFVFHTQTVFFMLFSIFVVLQLFETNPSLGLFIFLFLLYLIIAMKKFYEQSYLKTFLKFLLLNFSYFMVGIIGVIFVFLISFAMF